MKNFRMKLTYDGTRYKGWQRLGGGENTIQAKLENVLSRLLETQVEVIGSGRTDAGVHALGQVANFHADTDLTAGQILAALRQHLPEDIGVLSVEEAEPRFHSRLNAVGKTYRYRIWNSSAPCVFQRKYLWRVEEELDLSAMEQGVEKLLGTHDFLAFCSNKHFKKSSVRTLREIRIFRNGDELVLDVTGDGFLYNMVRIIVGTLVEIGLGTRSAEEIPGILESRRSENAGITAPACGLCLMEVEYP